MTHEIKETRAGDLPELQNVIAATGLFPPDMLPAMFDEGGALWLTAHLDGRPVGMCQSVPEQMADAVWNMQALAVHPEAQGRGLGVALVAATEARLRDEGIRMIVVDTSGSDDFAATRAFYTAQGYAQTGRIPDFWEEGDDKVTFCKRL